MADRGTDQVTRGRNRSTARIAAAVCGLVILLACATHRPFVVQIHAQSLPVTKALAWDASVVDATHTAPTTYDVRLDGALVASVPAATLTQNITFATVGPHTLTVTAVNTWGSSAASTLAVNVSLPNPATNMRIP